MIPKTLHIIWIGDETRRPDNCIQTWIDLNPTWTIKLWGNEDLAEYGWVNAAHMQAMLPRELNGVADMMRWEILYNEGGFLVDADSICVRPLDDALLDCEAFTCWESEIARPGLLAAGYFACQAGNPFVGQIILDIKNAPSVTHEMAWKTVGPQRLTDAYRHHAYQDLRILPSHTFIPEHFTGLEYKGTGTVYARQKWGSTLRRYDELHRQDFDADGRLTTATPSRGPVPAMATEQAPVAAAGSPALPSDRAAAADIPAAPAPLAGPAVTGLPTASAAPVSRLAQRHPEYFVQQIEVGADLVGVKRLDAFKRLCADRRVLHIGCADWPITDPKTSLHLGLEPHCVRLDGMDIHQEALDQLAPHVKGRLFNDLSQVKDSYDVVLVPEVLEHVPDVAGFLRELDRIDARHFVLTVPDAFQCFRGHFEYLQASSTFVEVVHPDHNCWYTPFTLTNVIRKFTDWTVDGMWFFNGISLLAVLSKPDRAVLTT